MSARPASPAHYAVNYWASSFGEKILAQEIIVEAIDALDAARIVMRRIVNGPITCDVLILSVNPHSQA